MQPQFQSSFIPKGPASTGASIANSPAPRRQQRDLFSFLSSAIFTISLLAAGGIFAYKFFLDYRITQMKEELQAARAELEPETVNELVRLNSRIVSTDQLLKNHRVISPVFEFLQASTPRSVRYTEFNFNASSKGLELNLMGEASSYAALAVAADILANKSPQFREVVFSNLSLDDKGNVNFSMYATVDSAYLLYDKYISPDQPAVQNVPVVPVPNPATSTSTRPTSTTTQPALPGSGLTPPAR